MAGRDRPAEAQPGTMGALSDTLQVALGAGGAVGAFAVALTAWIQSRPKRVVLRIRGADGAEVVLEAELKDPDAVPSARRPGHDARGGRGAATPGGRRSRSASAAAG